MKLFFIFPISGPKNGVNVISNYILQEFIQKGYFEITVIDTSQASHFQSFGKFSLKKIFNIFKILKSLFRVNKNEFVYLNFTPTGLAFYRDFIILFISKLNKARITIHIHANGLEKKIKWYNRFIFKNINIIVINKHQKDKLNDLSLYPIMLSNSLPDYYSTNSLPKTLSSHLKLIFLSNISEKKGINRIIKAAEIIRKHKVDCVFNIYGGALSKKDLLKIQELDKKYNFISYYGPIVKNEDKFFLLKENDALLFLSDNYYEVYPLVYIEALMSGLPIITTNQFVSKKLETLNVAFTLKDDMSNLIEILDYNQSFKDELKNRAREVYLNEYSFPKFTNEIKKIIKHDIK